MIAPHTDPWVEGNTLGTHLAERGISRREFLDFCGGLCVVLGLSRTAAEGMAAALQAQRRPSVVWVQLQECTGCVESVIRTAEPTIGNLVLDLISLDYSHTLMAASGHAAEAALQAAMQENAGQYLLIVTGSVPLADDGVYLTIGGRTARTILEEAAEGAAAVIAVGACAHWGSVQAARPNPTGAVGVSEIVKDKGVYTAVGFAAYRRAGGQMLPDPEPLGHEQPLASCTDCGGLWLDHQDRDACPNCVNSPRYGPRVRIVLLDVTNIVVGREPPRRRETNKGSREDRVCGGRAQVLR